MGSGGSDLPNSENKIDNTGQEWYDTCENITRRIEYMFDNEILADITFIIGETSTKCHKLILSISSPYFNFIFREDPNGTEILVDDDNIDHDTFKTMLLYIYKNIIPNNIPDILKQLYAAKKFQLYDLQRKCEVFLINNQNVVDIGQVLSLAHSLDISTLKTSCLEYIDVYAKQVFITKEFLEINVSTLELILERDTLQIPEMSIFLSAMKWCDKQSNNVELIKTKQSLLGKCIYLIRYPLMSFEDFVKGPVHEKFLSSDEMVNIFEYIGNKDETKLMKQFCSKKRND